MRDQLHASGPLRFAEKVTSSSSETGKELWQKHLSDHNSPMHATLRYTIMLTWFLSNQKFGLPSLVLWIDWWQQRPNQCVVIESRHDMTTHHRGSLLFPFARIKFDQKCSIYCTTRRKKLILIIWMLQVSLRESILWFSLKVRPCVTSSQT